MACLLLSAPLSTSHAGVCLISQHSPLRHAHRKADEILRFSMAPGVLSRRSCEVSSFESDEIPHPHGHQEGQDGSRWMGPSKTTGHGLQTSGRRRTVLARTSSWARPGIDCSGVKRSLKNTCRTTCHICHDGRGPGNSTECGSHGIDGDCIIDPERIEAQKGGKQEESCFRKGGAEEIPRQGRGHEGKGESQRSAKATICFGWNNGNGPCASLSPGQSCASKTPRAHAGDEDTDPLRADTLEEYYGKRVFIFFHHFAGPSPNDPLSVAVQREAIASGIKVKCISVEKSSGTGDLLQDEPYSTHLGWAHNGYIDAYHSGFPRTTFSKLRFTPADGIATTCTHHGRALRKEGKHGA